jgi:hypothetical protein
MKSRTDLAALVLVALAITAITVLSLYRQPVPEILSTVALVALGIGGGIAIPSRGIAGDVAATVATQAAVELVPAPREPAAVEAAPVATHAP